MNGGSFDSRRHGDSPKAKNRAEPFLVTETEMRPSGKPEEPGDKQPAGKFIRDSFMRLQITPKKFMIPTVRDRS